MVKNFYLSIFSLFVFPNISWGLINGQVAMPKMFPGLVRIDSAKCSGVFITQHHILTAGHCIIRKPDSFNVPRDEIFITLHSEVDLTNRPRTIKVEVERRDVHPTWYNNLNECGGDPYCAAAKSTTLDLGIITLKNKIPVTHLELNDSGLPDEVKITGSGCQRNGGFSLSALKWAHARVNFIEEYKIFVGMADLDTPAHAPEFCPGDSGSPVLGTTATDGIFEVLAINSYKFDENENRAAIGAAARVDINEAKGWIRSILEIRQGESNFTAFPNLTGIIFSAKQMRLVEQTRSVPEMSVSIFKTHFPELWSSDYFESGDGVFRSFVSLDEMEALSRELQGSTEPVHLVMNGFFKKMTAPYNHEILYNVHQMRNQVMAPTDKKWFIESFLHLDENFNNLDPEKQKMIVTQLMDSPLRTLDIFLSSL